MDEDSAFHFILAVFIVLLVFSYAFPGAGFINLLLLLAALLASAYILKGFVAAVLGGEYTTFWTGCALALILVLFFNQASLLTSIFNAFFKLIAGLAKAALGAL